MSAAPAFDDQLCVIEWIPFQYAPAPGLDTAQAIGHTRTAQRVLETLLALAEHTSSPERENLSQGVAAELARLEARCDLLLELVGRVLTQFEPAPPMAEVTLCAAGARWPAQALAVGDTGLLSLYLPIGHQLPVTLPIQVESVAGGIAEGRFLGSDEAFEDVLGRMVFRRHRRAIAESRLPK